MGLQPLTTWLAEVEPTCSQGLHKGWCLTDLTGGAEHAKRSNSGADNLQERVDWQRFHHCLWFCKQQLDGSESRGQPSQRAAAVGSPGLHSEPGAATDGW